MPYHSPSSNAIYTALNFSQNYIGSDDERTLTVDGFFKDYSEPSMINDFDWPDPEKHISIAECERLIAEAPKDKVLIPKLTNYRGRAIYMDADMLVFKDIQNLWNIPMNSNYILVQSRNNFV